MFSENSESEIEALEGKSNKGVVSVVHKNPGSNTTPCGHGDQSNRKKEKEEQPPKHRLRRTSTDSRLGLRGSKHHSCKSYHPHHPRSYHHHSYDQYRRRSPPRDTTCRYCKRFVRYSDCFRPTVQVPVTYKVESRYDRGFNPIQTNVSG